MNPDLIYRSRLTALQQHLRNGVPFLKWKYSMIGQWDNTDTVLVCGCAIAEASCLFRGENAELYRLVGEVAEHPSRPLGERRAWNQQQWDAMQAAVEQWFGIDHQEFNFLFVPLIDDDDDGKGHWFTEQAEAANIADGIQIILDGEALPRRDDDELTAICQASADNDDVSNTP